MVSAPFLQDPYFTRSVILLCECDHEGSFGFILNKYVEVELQDLVADMPTVESAISLGGPVQNESLYYIHNLGSEIPGSIVIQDDLCLGGDFEVLKTMIQNGEIGAERIRFFIGYSGWSAGQLDEEMKDNSWYVSEIGDLPLMDTEVNDLWGQVLSHMGGKFAALAHIPADPNMN